MPSSNFDRDVDEVIEHFNQHKPSASIFAWFYERSGTKCRALKYDPALRLVVPDLWWIDCDDHHYSICLNVPHEGPE